MASGLRLKQQSWFFLLFSIAKILTECLLVQEIELGTEYHDSIFAPESQPQEYQQPYVIKQEFSQHRAGKNGKIDIISPA